MRALIGASGALLLAGAACGVPSAAGGQPSGETLYRRHCYACHALEPGRDTPAGPTLHAVVGRAVAAQPQFNYSPALRQLATRHPRWTPALLDQFLADPQAAAPGTEMGLAGLDDRAERRALIDWLERRER